MNRGLFLFSIICCSICIFTGCQKPVPQPQAKNGVLDLSDWDFEQKGIVQIRGDFLFEWKNFSSTTEIKGAKDYLKTPGSWNNFQYEKQKVGAVGYGTYGFQLILPKENRQNLGIQFGHVSTAYRLFVEDSLIAQVGNPQKTEEQTVPLYFEQVYLLPDFSKDTLTITLQVANFHTGYSGGIIFPPEVGSYQSLLKKYNSNVNLIFFLFGSLIIIGLYHISLFAYRPQDRSTLYFALLCLLIALRSIGTDKYNLIEYLTWYNFPVRMKVAYLSYSLSLLVLFPYFKSLFPKEVSIWVLRIGLRVTGLYSFFVLATPEVIFSSTLSYFQFFTLCSLFYALGTLILAIIRKREGAFLFLLGFLILGVGVINDILYFDLVINTGAIFPYTMFLFILIQAIMLSIRFSKSFLQTEILSKELNEMNQNLEKIVLQRTQSLKETTQILQKKNKNITDSINYAKRIQEAVLPSITKIQSFFPNSFLLFRPLSTVSGDFYWAEEIENNKVVLAVADCTGHGVPGAFISLIADSFLTQIIVSQKIYEPHKVLKLLNQYIFNALNQAESQNKDGMDIALCVIDKNSSKLEFAGARRGFLFVQEGEMQYIKGTKASLGGTKKDIDFEAHSIELKNDFYFYLFSDGYPDQFGGEDGKKFMLKKLKKLIFDNHQKPMTEQNEMLKQTLIDWMNKGEESQIDDITVLGVKLT